MKSSFSRRLAVAFCGILTATSVIAQTTLPSVYITASDPAASEAGDTGTFRINRSSFGSFTNQDLVVYYAITGTASNGVDYVLLPTFMANIGSVTIPAGASNAPVTITPIEDSIPEPTESVILTLKQVLANSQDWTYQIINPSSATVNITDNDPNQPPTVSMVNPTNGASFNAPVNVLLQAQASDTDGSIFKVQFLNGTNIIGTGALDSDGLYSAIWTNPMPGTYNIAAKAIDNLEGRSTSAPVNIVIVGQTNTDIPVVTVTAPDATASEGGTNSGAIDNTGTFTLHRGGNTNSSLYVYCVYSGTASNGVDYSTLPSYVNIPPGVREVNVVLHPIDDALVEPTETATLSLAPPPTLPPVNYAIGTPSNATINIADNDTAPTNMPPSVHILAPTNGASFMAPANINIYADAHDMDDLIATVEFFAGTNSLGIATNCPACANFPNPFYLTWSNVAAGTYVLTAKATDSRGASTVSDPVTITVTEHVDTNYPPTVKIVTPGNHAAFTVPVDIGICATASDIDDTVATVEIFQGTNSLGLATGGNVTGTVSNVFCLVWSNVPPGEYSLTAKATDDRGASRTSEPVYISVRTNSPPPPPPAILVQITSPTNGSIFLGPTNISISADASSSNGPIARVDFFSGDHLIGSSSNAPFSIIWNNVWPGVYYLRARATDNTGTNALSAPVAITVRSAYENSFVKRALPLWYVPGVKLVAKLYASPRTNTLNWSAEDLPPTNWGVGAVSEGGAFDPASGKVKFGPFTNANPRVMSYEVTPPPGESGEKHFFGTATADGASSLIAGQSAIILAPAHPADISPLNWVMGSDEAAAYSDAWKNCSRWTNGPNPIPVSYVTRAGYLAQSGGGYTLSTNYPQPFPPLLWVPLTGDSGLCTPASTTREAFVTNSCGSAISALPTNYFAGVTFTVSITVNPPSNTLAYALEDRPPLGFVATNISGGGTFCRETRTVKWGAFLDNTQRVLTYDVTPQTNITGIAYFAGVASFDGHNIPITGQRVTRLGGGATPAVLQSMTTTSNGDRQITFTGTPGACYIIETSSDLQNWVPLDQLLNNDGVLQYTDPASKNYDNRFYRATPMQ